VFWVPEEDILRRARRDRVPYNVWRDQGFLAATPRNATDSAFHQVADRGGRVVVVSAKSIDPAANYLISGPHLVEQPPTAGTICQLRGNSGYAVVRDHLVNLEPGCLGV
jgi:hypothetical protein